MKYSIIIITHNRNELLRNCLESISHANHKNEYEIIVIINGLSHKTEELIKSFNLNIKTKTIQSSTPAHARNIAMQMSSYHFYCFLDDDTKVPQNYFEIAQKHLNQNIAVLGGPDRTYPNSNYFESAIGETLKSPLATGGTRHRHNSPRNPAAIIPSEKKFILCNLWISKKVLLENNLFFDTDFFRNEENVLLHHLRNQKMIYSPELYVYHKRKGSFVSLINAVSRSAFFRVKSIYKYPSSFSFFYFLPLISFLFFVTVSLIQPNQAITILYCYLAFVSLFSLRLKKTFLFPYIFIIHILIHIAYCIGLMGGILFNLPRKLSGQISD
jgi:glycosyltransferase involved in cell wall biosynthesis